MGKTKRVQQKETDLTARRYIDESQAGDKRTAYQHDKDRILHATAFRRLQYKTQVYVIHEGDLYRTRMTHSLEVAQIARGLAQLVGADMDLAEAIALAHDLGHAPFGHAGESKIRELLEPYGLPFEHNIQSYRVVTELEERYASHPGLNLTRATLEGIVRHQSYFDKAEDILASIPESIRGETSVYIPPALKQPVIEGQIVNISDIIAYATHDVEDALTVGLIDWESFKKLVERLEIHFLKRLIERRLEEELEKYRQRQPDFTAETLSKIKVRILSRLIINHLIMQAKAQTLKNLAGLKLQGNDLWLAVREQPEPVVSFPEALEKEVSLLVNDLLLKYVYLEPRVKLMTVKAGKILETLFQTYMEYPDTMPRTTQARLKGYFVLNDEERKSPAGRRRLAQGVADYISGMTDKYAMDTYQLLTQAYEKAL